jgi:hypothetical protein
MNKFSILDVEKFDRLITDLENVRALEVRLSNELKLELINKTVLWFETLTVDELKDLIFSIGGQLR